MSNDERKGRRYLVDLDRAKEVWSLGLGEPSLISHSHSQFYFSKTKAQQEEELTSERYITLVQYHFGE